MSHDVAQICLNGHVINDASRKYSESNKDYCPRCGEPTIPHVLNVKRILRGDI